MRVALVDVYYPAFLTDLYARHPDLADRDYSAQLAGIMDAFFGRADSYSSHLRALGHDAIDIVANAEPLQRRWATEHGVAGLSRALAGRLPTRAGSRHSRTVWRSIARAQVEAFTPDVVYCHTQRFFTRRDLDGLRRNGILVVGQIGSPLPPAELIEGFDLIITSLPHFVARLRRQGIETEYLPLGIDPRIVERLRSEGCDRAPDSSRSYDVAFVAGLNPRIHGRRVQLLEELCARRRVDVWGYGEDALPPDSSIRSHFHGTAWGLDMYRVLASTKIALNCHIDVADGYANNMRLYDATGMGALLLTDDGLNLGEFFNIGTEVVAYQNVGEIVHAVDHYLDHEPHRREIAAAGQRRTLGDHTLDRRVEVLAGILERRVSRS
jgi:spore maturation protein CgeB